MSKRSKYENEFFFSAPDLTDDAPPSFNTPMDTSSIFTSTRGDSYFTPQSYNPGPFPVPDKNSKVCHSCRNLVRISEDPFCPYCGNMLD